MIKVCVFLCCLFFKWVWKVLWCEVIILLSFDLKLGCLLMIDWLLIISGVFVFFVGSYCLVCLVYLLFVNKSIFKCCLLLVNWFCNIKFYSFCSSVLGRLWVWVMVIRIGFLWLFRLESSLFRGLMKLFIIWLRSCW